MTQETRPRAKDASQVTTVLKTDAVKVMQLLVPAGQKIPIYEAEGEIILHCLQGSVAVSALGRVQTVRSGELLYLGANEPFSIEGAETASLLATVVAAKLGSKVETIGG